mmetsp:Transcript_120957/g.287328  ORF Transcript_120957/g.287328 Transcript_120957/m.287328 type:complete len:281 (-) Transcript_120957:190-1032(-)
MTVFSLNWRSPLLTKSMKFTNLELASLVFPLLLSISTIWAACPRSASSTCGASSVIVSIGAASLAATSAVTAGAVTEAAMAGAGIKGPVCGPRSMGPMPMPMPIMGPMLIPMPIIGPIIGPIGPVLDIAAPAGPACACFQAPSIDAGCSAAGFCAGPACQAFSRSRDAFGLIIGPAMAGPAANSCAHGLGPACTGPPPCHVSAFRKVGLSKRPGSAPIAPGFAMCCINCSDMVGPGPGPILGPRIPGPACQASSSSFRPIIGSIICPPRPPSGGLIPPDM